MLTFLIYKHKISIIRKLMRKRSKPVRKKIRLKLLLLFISVVYIFTFPASAEDSTPSSPSFPFEGRAEADESKADITLDGQAYSLSFDDNPAFTSVMDGFVQASFYTYQENDRLIELYMIFPVSVSSGDEITSAKSMQTSDEDSGFILFTSVGDDVESSMATQDADGIYPDGSDYSILFEKVTRSMDSMVLEGTAKAVLTVVNEEYEPTGTFHSLECTFSFTIDTGTASDPGSESTPAQQDEKAEKKYKI